MSEARIIGHQGSIQNTFELRSIHTAKILSIETSCDETAVAVLDINGELEKPDIKILGNTLLSQMHLHEKYGGVYPNLAKREHEKNLPILLEKTLEQAGFPSPAKGKVPKAEGVDLIAVTSGPGLEPALWVGITFAEKLGKKWNKPIIPVNHMTGHIWSVLFEGKKMELPAIALLVSGGHTELVYIKDFEEYKIMGRTRDDAVGEAFDKVARMLGLPYPGGPQISKLAEKNRSMNHESRIMFPRPMINSGDLDFSYSGLKTAVLYKLRDLSQPSPRLGEGGLSPGEVEEMARAFEDAAVEVLIKKTRKAILEKGDIKTLIVGGGVSANHYLRQEIKKMAQNINLEIQLPSVEMTGDNALMIGLAAYVKVKKDPGILKNHAPIIARGNATLG
ncbi:MAG: tRNA (adenosine(37)-N6)-threonylcarbamoyltransferase complex transferase subunit TsaD [Candidatus Zambryskibacteria bacterium]|nr:tRNA (adenosine(37)-N6)-threonylcarbamoyltransferase complex transferase subunit TsaD [Candidatus Zambryskibacteria bacterium]